MKLLKPFPADVAQRNFFQFSQVKEQLLPFIMKNLHEV